MTFTGHYIGGQIVPDVPLALPEGSAVRCEIEVSRESDHHGAEEVVPTLRERLKNFLAHSVELPPDAATNHDYYLKHGLPGRSDAE